MSKLSVAGMLIAAMAAAFSVVLAGNAPDSIYGNYHGTGACPPGPSMPCTSTRKPDNILISKLTASELDEQRRIQDIYGIPAADTRVILRFLRDHGRGCVFEGLMRWSGDHLEFKDAPPAHGAFYVQCKLQLWPTSGKLEIKDPGNVCSEKYCAIDQPVRLANTRFTKGHDQLLAASKQPISPPPESIFGTYRGTGQCAKDERKTEICTARTRTTDYVDIKPGKYLGAQIVIGRRSSAGDSGNYCAVEADAVWFGNHLAVIKDLSDKPGNPNILQFWFKGDTVVTRDIDGNVCGALIQGALFKKDPIPPDTGKQD